MSRVPFIFLGSLGSISWGSWRPFCVKISLRIRLRIFRNMACRLHEKLIFMLWAFTLDAKTRHGPIPGTALDFFVAQDCSSGNEEARRRLRGGWWENLWVAFWSSGGTRGSQNEQIASHAFMTPEGSADIYIYIYIYI